MRPRTRTARFIVLGVVIVVVLGVVATPTVWHWRMTHVMSRRVTRSRTAAVKKLGVAMSQQQQRLTKQRIIGRQLVRARTDRCFIEMLEPDTLAQSTAEKCSLRYIYGYSPAAGGRETERRLAAYQQPSGSQSRDQDANNTSFQEVCISGPGIRNACTIPEIASPTELDDSNGKIVAHRSRSEGAFKPTKVRHSDMVWLVADNDYYDTSFGCLGNVIFSCLASISKPVMASKPLP